MSQVRFLRHPPLFGALVVLVLLATLLASAWAAGFASQREHPGPDTHAELLEVAAYRNAAADLLVLAATPDDRLSKWSAWAAAHAEAAADRAGQSRGDDHQLTRLWRRAAQSAAALAAVDPTDAGAVAAARDRVHADADDLAALVAAGPNAVTQPTGLVGDVPYDRATPTTTPPARRDVTPADPEPPSRDGLRIPPRVGS